MTDLLAHEVTGGAGAATVSVVSALVMAVILCLLVGLVFVRRARQDATGETSQPNARNGSGT
jgi:hypothetical protein